MVINNSNNNNNLSINKDMDSKMVCIKIYRMIVIQKIVKFNKKMIYN